MGIGSSPVCIKFVLYMTSSTGHGTLNNCNNNSRKDTEIRASPIQKPSFSHNAPCYFLNIQRRKIVIQNWSERNQTQPLNIMLKTREIRYNYHKRCSSTVERQLVCLHQKSGDGLIVNLTFDFWPQHLTSSSLSPTAPKWEIWQIPTSGLSD